MITGARLLAGLALALCTAASAAAQDVVGAWNMTYTTRDGVKMSSTLTLKSEGGTLSGTISSPRGSVALDEVSVKGEDVAFAVIRVGFGDRIRIDYTGKVKGDMMTLKMKVGAREPIDVTAKRGQ
jgi:hypothetical protein